jgi:Lrp/AsnC family leucine-responsive transcriptional regulator
MRRLHDLDTKDREILALLEADGRRANSEIARLTSLSAPTVAERIARLRDIGVIKGFTVDIDPARIGLPIAAIIEFQPRSNDDERAVTAINNHQAVQCCYRVTGPSLLVVIVRVADNAALTRLLAEFTHYGDTKTAVILSTELCKRHFFADAPAQPMP